MFFHWKIACERMHLVIGHSFYFTTIPFGTGTDPLEFVLVVPHSSVSSPQVIYCRLHHNLLAEIEAISAQCTETTFGDKLLRSELIPTKHFHFFGYKFNHGKGEVSP